MSWLAKTPRGLSREVEDTTHSSPIIAMRKNTLCNGPVSLYTKATPIVISV